MHTVLEINFQFPGDAPLKDGNDIWYYLSAKHRQDPISKIVLVSQTPMWSEHAEAYRGFLTKLTQTVPGATLHYTGYAANNNTRGRNGCDIEIAKWETPETPSDRDSQKWHMITHCTKDLFRKALLIAQLATDEGEVSFYNKGKADTLIALEKQTQAQAKEKAETITPATAAKSGEQSHQSWLYRLFCCTRPTAATQRRKVTCSA